MAAPIHVLVVDDSAVVRQVMTAILTALPGFTVEAASDPLIALNRMQRVRPDVILLDLEMPRMHGLDFLRQVMASDPIPVVVCSSHTGRGSVAAMRALEAGAVEVVAKSGLAVREFLEERAAALADTLRAAARARLHRPAARAPVQAPSATSRRLSRHAVVVMGASTGGTEALREVILQLPPEAPGTVVVQHMPEGFTRAFAQRLDEECRVAVQEAAGGERVERGRVLIAPGGRHLRLRADTTGALFVDVYDGPAVNRHRPAVDVLFHSAATVAGSRAAGVLLTGMGEDGADGLLAMRRAGAFTVAQDEATSVVWGMPAAAVERGAACVVAPLQHIAGHLLNPPSPTRVRP